MSLLRREPPLTPTDDEARAWAQSELAKAIYRQEPTLWDRITRWLWDLWQRILDQASGAGPVVLPLLILLAAALVIGLAVLLGGPIRRRRLRAAGSVAVLDDDSRSSEQLRAAADAAAAAGEFALAVLERFRALVRSLDERAVLEDRQGRTAREAASAAGARLPDQAADLLSAARLFDDVAYGSARPGPEQDGWLRDLDAAVRRARPTRTGDAVAADDLVAPR